MKEMHCMQKLQAMIYVPIIISVWEAWAESPKLVGLHSGELSSGHLIIPRRVNENGAFLSYNLTYQHNEHYYHEPHRRKRRGVHDCKDGIIHYQLQLPEETLHLELEPHNYFMTPHLIVERHRRDLRSRRKPTAKNTNCHFHGEIRGHADSKVAISTCAGLVGHIKSKNNEYFIEPSKEHKLSTLDGHPHVVFQRPAVKQKKYNKSKRKKHKKSKKPTKQAMKRKQNFVKQSILSNCGTKEPRRHLETRLEWRQKGKIKIQDGRHIRGRHNRNYNQNHIQEPALHLRSKTLASLPAAIRRRRTYNEISNNSYTITNSYNNNINVASSNESNNYYVQHSNIHDRQWRKKRSISSPRHVETLLVADATMAAIHEDVDTYLLTIMNMVSSLYKDPSIGNFIEIVVVKIIQLEHDDAHLDLNLTQNAQQNLDMFCKWQHKLNEGNDNDPHHHDVAILLTRKNICGNNCMTLGLANVGGMCKPKQSCSVNEDNGIMLSHTVAHELGHNFGMFHDSAKIGCHPRIGSIVHIMTPTFGADTLQVSWSNCSRKFITQFLDQGLGDCLDDEPTPSDEYYYPVYQPGVIFNAEIQCRLQFNITDGDVGPCSTPNEFCSTLWCRVNGECVTNMRPTAPGTSCGKNKWCQKGDCVRMKNITVLDGGWGNWSEWSECTSSCGGGISIQQRECNNPVPANGGLFCIGERKRYNICQTQDCPSEKSSFRAQQCSRFDKVPYQGHIYKWLPHFDKKNPCKLFCTDEDDTIIAHWKDLVEDGTPCKLGTNNMCIDGICRKVGCDWELDSEVEEDRCGICGGNGDHCKTIKEVFIEPFNTTDNYVEIVTIPAKARQIVIKELANSPHFLSIAEATPGDSNSIKFYLNGDNLISMPGEFIIAGAESLYERNDDQEVISIPHSIDHAIMLYIVVSGTDPNEGVYYEFTLPALNSSDFDKIANYSWKLSHWTACSATCGGGQQYREVACYKNDEYLNNDVPCWLKVTEARPLRKTRSCNVHRCPSHWWTGPWSFCPDNCKNSPEEPALKRRSVMCLNHQEVVVEDIHCNLETRPADSEPCIQYLTNCQSENKLDTFFLQVPDL